MNGAPQPITSVVGSVGFSGKSTAAQAQYARIVAMLETGKKNTMELRKGGVMMPAARIKEMKDRLGYDIPTVERVSVYDEDGFLHPSVAVYEMLGKPKAAP